jgi:hypothetical protein
MKMLTRTGLFAAAALALMPANAQWLKIQTPGIPRTPDGKPNLSAPAPKTADGKPDLSGIWEPDGTKYLRNIASDLKAGDIPFRPAALAIFNGRKDGERALEESDAHCLPQGVPKIDAAPVPFKIIETPGLVIVLYEAFNLYRQIFTDGRELPKDPNPSWLGYSVGKWEGDTLVVDSIGFNDKTWLDQLGYPHSDALHVTERFHRKDLGHMELQITIDDPKMYTKPWTITEDPHLLADTELLEFICNENNRDLPHIISK